MTNPAAVFFGKFSRLLSNRGLTLQDGKTLIEYTGPRNYIANGHFEIDSTGWAATGTATVARTTTAANILTGDASGLLTTGSSGDLVSYAFTIPANAVDLSKTLVISFDYRGLGSYASGDFSVLIRDVTNSVTVTPTTSSIPSGEGRFSTTFAATAGTSYELRFSSGSTSSRQLSIDTVFVGPEPSGSQSITPFLSQYNMNVGDSGNSAKPLNTNLLGDVTAIYKTATVTMTIASPCVITWTAHGLIRGDPLYLTTTGALPTGLTASTTYYVSNVVSANTISVTAVAGNADINTSGSQSGTHTAYAGGLRFPQPSTGSGVRRAYSVHSVNSTGGASAFGTTNTKVRRFNGATAPVNGFNGDFNYGDSATAGSTWTITTPGLYAMTYSDRTSTAGDTIGITINSTAAPQGLDGASLIAISNIDLTGTWTTVSGLAYLANGDVIRCTADATTPANYTNNASGIFRIHRVI